MRHCHDVPPLADAGVGSSSGDRCSFKTPRRGRLGAFDFIEGRRPASTALVARPPLGRLRVGSPTQDFSASPHRL